MAIRISSRCRWRRCCRTPTTANAASSIGDKASLELRPGIDRGLRRAWSSSRAERWRRRRRADGRPAGSGEPTVGALGDDARRHRAFRHHRSGRQHGLGDAVGRLAAFLAGHSRTRLLPRHPRADVLAGRGPSGGARARQAAAHHAVADAWRCATASRIWPGARPAATSRTSGSRRFFLRHVHCGMNLQEAIDAPAWHSEHFPSSFWPRTARPGVLVIEGRVPKETIAELERRGHASKPGRIGRKAGSPPRRVIGPRRRAAANAAACRVTRRGGEFLILLPLKGGGRRPWAAGMGVTS